MADYIYLLRTRLTPAQQAALEHVRESARAHGMTVFLAGGAIRDLTSGSPIRDLDVAVQGNALKLRKELEKRGGVSIGENDQTQSLYFNFPRGVRLEVGSTLTVNYPKPGKPVYRSAGILDDLRRRDFTANAMAISLNEGSFGLLLDPLNGVADIENRELRLVSNYGFIEDPARMIRAARLSARFGWQMEEKTQQRYETGKTEDYIAAMAPVQRGYELEEVFHEEDPLRVLRRLESEGWAKTLFPAWTSARANEPELDRLRDTVGQLEAMGIHPDPSAAYFPLLTAKLSPKEVTALKGLFARPGFVDQIAALEADTKEVAAQFSSKAAAAPSDAWKMLFASAPEPVLWLAHTTKSAPMQARFKAFFNDWSQARQKIPYQLMQEMRITPELPGYEELLENLFFAIMDAKLETPEAAKAFLEPFSPPAPPPPVNLRRRAVKRETKPAKVRTKKVAASAPVDLAAADATQVPAAPGTMPAGKAVSATTAAPKAGAPKAAATKAAAPKPAAKPAPVKSEAAPTKLPAARLGTKQPASKSASSVAAKQPGKVAVKQTAKVGGKPPAKAAASKKAVKAVQKPSAKTAAKHTGAKSAAKKPAQQLANKSFGGAKKAPLKSASVTASAKNSAKKPSKPTAKAKKAVAKSPAKSKGAGKGSVASSGKKTVVKAGSKAKSTGRR
jgi:tRNA nucleotidyltransferase (CCA-adding enzyme)